MTAPVIDELEWRGLIAQSTDLHELRSLLDRGPVVFYCGFDPTAQSLHIGNLAQILTARRLQLAGHRPIALVGGATGLIGDPKQDGERRLNESSVVAAWGNRLRCQLSGFFDSEGPNALAIVDNHEWIGGMSAVELLRDIGKHFSVNVMLDREAVSTRLAGSGISYTEFSYQVLQAYDFLHLRRVRECMLQIGGSDQWGNIVAGIDLVRRVDGIRVHGLTTHLVTKADGAKFGKTESGTVWLDPAMTSPYAFYQFWMNAEDQDVPGLLRTYSFAGRDEVEELEAETVAQPARRVGQRRLAEDVTSLVHGADQAAAAWRASNALFGGDQLEEVDPGVLGDALSETTVVKLSGGVAFPTVVDLAVDVGLVSSRSAARRLVAEGGLYLNNHRVDDEALRPTIDQVLEGGWLVLRRGKRHIAAALVQA